ncbi:MAG: hypothetical protein HY758_09355 [Nitrospirae bacterium]|nr:hypothetical protein [Nitrospirota bacterium]
MENISLISNDTETASAPSQQRHEDILTLVRHYINAAGQDLATGHKKLSGEAEEYILSYPWDTANNELERAIKKACILSDDEFLNVEDFDLKYRHMKSIGVGKFIEEKLKGFMKNIKNLEKFNLYETVIPEVERALITMVIKETNGNQLKAAKLLGINRNTLRDKVRKLKISVKSIRASNNEK